MIYNLTGKIIRMEWEIPGGRGTCTIWPDQYVARSGSAFTKPHEPQFEFIRQDRAPIGDNEIPYAVTVVIAHDLPLPDFDIIYIVPPGVIEAMPYRGDFVRPDETDAIWDDLLNTLTYRRLTR